MSLAARGATCVASGRLDVDVSPLSSVCASLHRFFFIENRAEVHEARRSHCSARESGCPVHKKKLLPVLVDSSLQKKRNHEQHALDVKASPLAAWFPPRNVRQRVHLANDDDLERTLVVPATAPGAAADEPKRP